MSIKCFSLRIKPVNGFAYAALAAALLAGCGGGGGGGGSGSSGSSGNSNGGPTVNVCSSATSTLTGTATAQYPGDYASPTTAALNYGAVVVKPIRGVVAELVESQTSAVLATTETGADGSFAFSNVVGNKSVFVRIKAQMLRASSPKMNFRVVDNTQGRALYVLDTPTATLPCNGSMTLNAQAGLGWTGSSYTQTRASAPFAIIDMAYKTVQKLTTDGIATAEFPALTFNWSKDNTDSPGDATKGQITTSHFMMESFDGGRTYLPQVYILGKENQDTDEFDEAVIAHETGHYLQAVFSNDDSTGGAHANGNRLDMALAFSEGFGTAWGSIVIDSPYYRDSNNIGQQQGGVTAVGTTVTANPGYFNENSVMNALWNSYMGLDKKLQPIWQVLTDTAFVQAGTHATVHHFGSRLVDAVPASKKPTVISAFAAQKITLQSNDVWGNSETNKGTMVPDQVIYTPFTGATGQSVVVCMHNQNVVASGYNARNKLGNRAFIRFTQSSTAALSVAPIAAGTAVNVAGGIFTPTLTGNMSTGLYAIAKDQGNGKNPQWFGPATISAAGKIPARNYPAGSTLTFWDINTAMTQKDALVSACYQVTAQ